MSKMSKTTYLGGLRTEAIHIKSSTVIVTDAPVDNQGKGESFSPTDLVATSLGACMLTIMGIKARDKDIDMEGATVETIKTMASNPRRISKIEIMLISYKGGGSGSSITLNGSKSISNRILIIRALCADDFQIENLSTAKDTSTLSALISQIKDGAVLDTGAAGTTYRFLTAHLAFSEGTQILTGSERMKQRPIKVLVEALTSLGAKIEYLEEEGYPPLKIMPAQAQQKKEVSLLANVSSQYISALMLIAPYLPSGLRINLVGDIVSLPYLLMTKNLMESFGAEINFDGASFSIAPGKYTGKPFKVEGDWSAASYYYAIVAFEKPGYTLEIGGINGDSLQGDNVMAEIGQHFGVMTIFKNQTATLTKMDNPIDPRFDFDFVLCPDLTQTVSVMMAGLGVSGKLTGLKTLRIKETDRINALNKELIKTTVSVDDQDKEDSFFQQGQSNVEFVWLCLLRA